MLFAVLSEPLPTRPSEAAAQRRRYWDWARPLQEAGVLRHIWARTGRGALAIVEVDGNDTLHRLLNEWADIIPARSTCTRCSIQRTHRRFSRALASRLGARSGVSQSGLYPGFL